MSEIVHPTTLSLELFAAGDTDASVAAHLATCDVCAKSVNELTDGAADFAKNEADAFLKMVSAKAQLEASSTSGAAPPTPPALSSPSASLPEIRTPTPTPTPNNVIFAKFGRVAAPIIVAAAAVLLLVRSNVQEGSAVTPSVSPSNEPQRFKGGLSVAVVRERAGSQERIAGDMSVRANDRARVEVSLDRSQPISAGILEDDGTWTVLLAPAMLDRGTHYSEQAARFDERPTNGVIIVGEPSAVDRARTTKDFAHVTVIKLHPEGGGN
jgi:hypothetical protein